jgi:ankyrin repeat protein
MANQLGAFTYLLSLPSIDVDVPDGTGRTPFFYAVQNGNVIMMGKILAYGRVNCAIRNRNSVLS